jgi:hypothetical protein
MILHPDNSAAIYVDFFYILDVMVVKLDSVVNFAMRHCWYSRQRNLNLWTLQKTYVQKKLKAQAFFSVTWMIGIKPCNSIFIDMK